MSVFEHKEFDNHQRVVFAHDAQSGLRAVIAIHNLNLGPALGGCRIYPYETEADALTDALRLSKAMTYKAALANLALGGGKSVIIADPAADKTTALLLAMGKVVEDLRGDYLIAQDSGTQLQDLRVMERVTQYCAASQDPAESTALGVYAAIIAAVTHHFSHADLGGLRVAVQGLGNVGYALAKRLRDAGAVIYVNDIDAAKVERAVQELQATAVSATDLLSLDVDVFAPCALGAVINDECIDSLRATIVAGAANNQLAQPQHADALAERGITYAPDYVANAGGLIYLQKAREGCSDAEIEGLVAEIGATLQTIFSVAAKESRNTLAVADSMAEARFSSPLKAADALTPSAVA